MSFTELFIAFIMGLIILLYIKSYYGEVEYVHSKLDDRKYLVRKLPDRKDAADMLSRLNAKLTRLVQHVKAGGGKPGGGIDPADARRLYDNYNPDALSEGGTEVGYTSYSVNKGEKIVMCLRHRDTTFVDENVLVYVAVHELGHLMTDEIGHTDRFWSNFRALLREAVSLGLYAKVDFAAKPVSYCGINITSSVI
jgi:hypothetical protein